MKITYYKLYCKDEDIYAVYIGSTKDLQARIWAHKTECNLGSTHPVHMFINVNGGFENWAFEILDEIEVESKEEKLKIERKFVEKFSLNLNCELPGRTRKEWKKDNAEKIKKWKEERFTCECGSKIRQAEKPRHFRTQKHINYIELNK
tara:strand:+ start:282 stop:725 length:444 start_codon:yes stop_codon:yes gene_type:complete